MKPALLWNVVFYSWLLFSPTLPFYACFVRLHWMGVRLPIIY
jgi:hypothetical protein